jgi:hypothetical protein
MMGISPSSVQTRVVQNSSLQSPFNPQGFGVISPTVGQHSFSDAARMHKGENLRTTNLPNFAFGDVLSTEKGKGMTFAKPSFEKIIDPGAAGTMDVKVVDHSEKALKSLEKAYSDPMERRSRLEKGTRLGGMTTVAGGRDPQKDHGSDWRSRPWARCYWRSCNGTSLHCDDDGRNAPGI